MSIDRLSWLLESRPVVIGMIHLPPLAGSPRYNGQEALEETVLRDVEALMRGGIGALMLENFGDAPFFPDRVPAETIAQMARLACLVKSRTELPLGINVLRNDGRSALAIAQAVGAAFIRVNILCGARVTDQGLIQGIAHDLLRDRARLHADRVAILADVNVKHSAPLAEISLETEVKDLIERGGADGLIVSGLATEQAVETAELEQVRSSAGSVPVFVGSGVTIDNLPTIRPHVEGLIVGTAFKKDGKTTNPIDENRVRDFMNEIDRLKS